MKTVDHWTSTLGAGLQETKGRLNPPRAFWYRVLRTKYATPAKPGNFLMKGDPDSAVDAKTQTYFRSGVGKMIHMM